MRADWLASSGLGLIATQGPEISHTYLSLSTYLLSCFLCSSESNLTLNSVVLLRMCLS